MLVNTMAAKRKIDATITKTVYTLLLGRKSDGPVSAMN